MRFFFSKNILIIRKRLIGEEGEVELRRGRAKEKEREERA